MTIFRGPGGTGSATSDSDTTEFQEFLVQSQAARDAALAAKAAAELAETNAETAETNAETAATNAASSASAASTSASNAATSASNAASSATSAADSASAAAASAASINPADIVHISGTETITGAKTFSQTITGSITGNAGTATNGVVTTGSYADPAWITSLAGSKVSGNISGNAANVTGTVDIANGGTGQTTRQNAMDALAGSVTNGQYLRGNGTDVVMSAIQVADVPTLNQNTTGTASNVTGVVAVANGGTGVTTSTGSGSVVLSSSPTLTTPNINSAQFATVTGTAPIYPCRAWVNFNGTGTVAIRASGNVTSITDNGTGDYTVNFTTAMPDANYAATGSGQNISGLYSSITLNSNSNGVAGVTNPTTTAFRFTITAGGIGVVDSAYVNVAIFR